MTELYIAHWATQADFECFQDDGSGFYDTVSDMAEPAAAVLRDIELPTLNRLFSHISRELRDMDEGMPSSLSWELDVDDPQYKRYTLRAEGDPGDIYASLIIRGATVI